MAGRSLRPEERCPVCLPKLSQHPLERDEILFAFDVSASKGEDIQEHFREVFGEIAASCGTFRFCLHSSSLLIGKDDCVRVTVRCQNAELADVARIARLHAKDVLVGESLSGMADFFLRESSFPPERIRD